MMLVALTPSYQIAAIVMSFFLSFWNLFSGFLIPRMVSILKTILNISLTKTSADILHVLRLDDKQLQLSSRDAYNICIAELAANSDLVEVVLLGISGGLDNLRTSDISGW